MGNTTDSSCIKEHSKRSAGPSRKTDFIAPRLYNSVNYMYEGRTESREQLFLHANWEQQTKESAVVDGTRCCVILECLVTSIACIT